MHIREYAGTDCLDVAEVVALEQKIASEGTPLAELMERAGAALAEAVEKMGPDDDVTIFAGTGNNGGDGWVAARILGGTVADSTHPKRRVTLITPRTAADLTAEPARTAALACEEARRAGDSTVEILVAPSDAQVAQELARTDIVVDAMLGTGFAHAEVREPLKSWIRLINDAFEDGITTVAADCPSGLNAQTGAAATPVVTADYTVTMLVAKTGLLKPEAAPYVGKLFLAPLI